MPSTPATEANLQFARLAQTLTALSSPTRLELLRALREAHRVADLRVSGSIRRPGERPERALARPTVAHHVEQLLAAGFVRQVRSHDGSADQYVLDDRRLFALVEEMRSLAKLRPILPDPGPVSETLERPLGRAFFPPRPRLVVCYGREDSMAFPLDVPAPQPWAIGRDAECHICLDYDPFLSARHATVSLGPQGYELRDMSSRNGTWLNWERLADGQATPLRTGDLITVGRSILVAQF